MIPGLLSFVLHSCLVKKNAPHLIAECGARMPGYQRLKVLLSDAFRSPCNWGYTIHAKRLKTGRTLYFCTLKT